MKTLVIIKGNPKYVEGNNEALLFYDNLKNFLESLDYSVTFDDGEPMTVPPVADVWVGHSRGCDRLRFAPKETKTIALGTMHGIHHPDDKSLTVGGTIPDISHFTLTDEMKEKIKIELGK